MEKNLLKEIFEEIDKRQDEMIEHRRHIHKNAELSFEEKETAEYLADYYKGKNVEVTTNMGGYGLRVVIDTKKTGQDYCPKGRF